MFLKGLGSAGKLAPKCQRDCISIIKDILTAEEGYTRWSQHNKNDTLPHLWSMMDNFKILLLTFYLKPKTSILEQ